MFYIQLSLIELLSGFFLLIGPKQEQRPAHHGAVHACASGAVSTEGGSDGEEQPAEKLTLPPPLSY